MSGPVVPLPGSSKHAHQMRECSKCLKQKDPGGGIQMSPTKWRCSECWRGFTLKRK